MLLVTPFAAEAINQLVDQPDVEGLRISTAPGSSNSSGPSLALGLAPGPAPDDAVVEAEHAKVFLDPTAARALDQMVLDADLNANEVQFSLRDQ